MVGLDTEQYHTHKQQQEFLSKGKEVEVRSDEEGFRGAWFRATIIESPLGYASKKRKSALVQYKTLVTEDGSNFLTEPVDPALIRPLPPEDGDGDRGFQENDAVDARYQDGWWSGIVRKILGNSRYRVYFDNPPDVIDFDQKDLRLHWEWVDGNWVRPEKQQTKGSVFSSGAAVEVNIDTENYRDVWLPAIVIKENGDDTFLVKYESSRNGDEIDTVKVTVDTLHIRPTPLHSLVRDFELLERVDAWFDVGWRSGVITKVLAGRKYNVFFKNGNEDRELSHSEMRLHMDWIDDKWVGKSEEVLNAGDDKKLLGHAYHHNDNIVVPAQAPSSDAGKDNNGGKISCSTNITKIMMDQSTSCKDNSYSRGLPPRKKKIKLPAPNGSAAHSCPSKNLTEGCAAEAPLSVAVRPLGRTPKKRSSGKATYVSANSKAGGKAIKSSKKAAVSNKPSAKLKSRYEGQDQGLGESDNQTSKPARRRGRRAQSLSESPQVSAAVGSAAGETNGNKSKVKQVELPVILGLKAKRSEDSLAEDSCQLPVEKLPKLTSNRNKNLSDSGGDRDNDKKGGATSQRRKRGRPVRRVVRSPKSSDAVDDQEVAGSVDKVVVKAHTSIEELPAIVTVNPTELSLASCQRRKRGRPLKRVVISPKVSDAVEGYNGAAHVADEMIVRDLTSNEGLAAVVKVDSTVSEAAAREKSSEVAKEVDVKLAIAYVSNNCADDDQPLSTWFGGMHASTSFEESRPMSARGVNGLHGGKERQICTTKDFSIQAMKSSVLDDNQRLPFVKRSPVWKTIESMDVFRTVPQNPHFLPLAEIKEEYREGSAIGIMVTFASLFDKITILQFEDPRSTYDSTLESLLDLENHGFDVTILRGRINELLSIKHGQDQLVHESKDAERLIMEHTEEKTKYEKEMEDIMKKIAELEEHHAVIKSKKENKEQEISSLRLHMNAMNGRIQNSRYDFETIASAPWTL